MCAHVKYKLLYFTCCHRKGGTSMCAHASRWLYINSSRNKSAMSHSKYKP